MNVKDVLGDLGLKGLKDYNRDFRYGQNLHLTIDKKLTQEGRFPI